MLLGQSIMVDLFDNTRLASHACYLRIRSCSATTVASTPVFTLGPGKTLNSGLWWLGSYSLPAWAAAMSSGAVPPTVK